MGLEHWSVHGVGHCTQHRSPTGAIPLVWGHSTPPVTAPMVVEAEVEVAVTHAAVAVQADSSHSLHTAMMQGEG